MDDLSKKFNKTSKIYDLIDYPFERFRYRKIRKKIWSRLTGKILDAGVGTGCNIPYYPKEAEVIGIDVSRGMLEKAKKKAKKLSRPVELREASVHHLPFSDSSFDYVVATFLCCVVQKPLQAALELKRVCKKGGQVIFLEYVLSKKLTRRTIQRLITPWTRFMFGVDFTQNTLLTLKKAGYEVVSEENLTSDILKLIITRPV